MAMETRLSMEDLIEKSLMNGPLSIAMFDYRGYTHLSEKYKQCIWNIYSQLFLETVKDVPNHELDSG